MWARMVRSCACFGFDMLFVAAAERGVYIIAHHVADFIRPSGF
jgi:hypothetical protein